MDATLFAAGLATYYAAHQVADHVFGQNDHQASNKVKPGLLGWAAMAGHVFSYHTVMIVMLFVTLSVFNLPVSILGLALSILFSAVSHAFIDRRWPVRWILEKTGSANFAKMTTPLNGMYLGDQGLHYLCLWIAALLLCL
jgi:hypothetical protein